MDSLYAAHPNIPRPNPLDDAQRLRDSAEMLEATNVQQIGLQVMAQRYQALEACRATVMSRLQTR
jgi:hypothetical protein